jgi:flagellar biosynthesis/type III secretory pathway protein FliH
VIENYSSKCKFLNSNLSERKKEERKEGKKEGRKKGRKEGRGRLRWEDCGSKPAWAKKVVRSHFNQWLGTVVHSCHPS